MRESLFSIVAIRNFHQALIFIIINTMRTHPRNNILMNYKCCNIYSAKGIVSVSIVNHIFKVMKTVDICMNNIVVIQIHILGRLTFILCGIFNSHNRIDLLLMPFAA